jgi:hypothetical protein
MNVFKNQILGGPAAMTNHFALGPWLCVFYFRKICP